MRVDSMFMHAHLATHCSLCNAHCTVVWVYKQGGRVQGYGVMEYSRGSKYEGEWRMGKKWGQGSMTYPDGARYDGQWQVIATKVVYCSVVSACLSSFVKMYSLINSSRYSQ
jgi:hypothetical protein